MEKIPLKIYRWAKNDKYNGSPVIECRIDMCKVRLLIDTGASVSFIDSKFVKTHPMLSGALETTKHTTTTNMVGGFAKSDKVLNTENLIFKGDKFNHQFNVIDLNIKPDIQGLRYDGVLGFDFLSMHSVTLDFGKNNFAV